MSTNYNHCSIKQYKGRMIRLTWTKKGEIHNVTGLITASTNRNILFRVNRTSELEIRLTYDQIVDIKELKP